MKYNLASSSWDHKEIDAMNRVIDSGFYTMGKNVEKFETVFSSFFGSKYALMVNSGSSANLLSVASLFFLKNNPLQRGDEVIAQSFNFIATVEAIHDLGAIPVIVRIDKTLHMCPDELKANISKKTKAIMPVHMFGVPAKISEIIKLANEKSIPIVEDACEAVGASYGKKYVGTLTEMGIFSLDYGKNITTGEGGVILSRSKNFDRKAREYHDHGHKNIQNLPRGLDKVDAPGFNYRMGEMNAVVGKVQLKKLTQILNQNTKRYMALEEKLKCSVSIEIREIPEYSKPSYDTYIFEIKDAKKKEKIIELLYEEGYGTKNLPDAIRWHCSYFWNYFLSSKKNKSAKETYKKLSRCIAIPISLKKSTDSYKILGAKLLKLLDA